MPENRNKIPPLKRTPSGILIEQVGIAKKSTPESEQTKRQVMFMYKSGTKLKTVQITGSFDKWQIRYPLHYDFAKASWHTTLQLAKGRYIYKFIVDGVTWVHSFDHPTDTDTSGNVNNYVDVV